jgi:sugar lactone lactonase YvrE
VLFVAVGQDGRLYRTEGMKADQVVRVEADGRTTVVASDIRDLNGMAVDGQGNVFVSEDLLQEGSGKELQGRVVKFQPDGHQELVASVASPSSVAVDGAGVVYVVDGLTSVERIAPGSPPQVIAQEPQVEPVGLAVGPSGELYISDRQHGTIWRRDSAGQMSALVAPGQVRNPTYLAVGRDGEVYVCQTGLGVFPWGLVGFQQALQVPILIVDRGATVHRLGLRADSAVMAAQDVAVAPSGDLYLTDGSGVYVARAPLARVPVGSRAVWLLTLPIGAALAVLGAGLLCGGFFLLVSNRRRQATSTRLRRSA